MFAILPYFVQFLLPHAKEILSPPTLTFSCASRCSGVSASGINSPAGSTQGPSWQCIRSPQCVANPTQAHCFISSSLLRCPVCFQSSSLRILLGHQIYKMLLRLLLKNTCKNKKKKLILRNPFHKTNSATLKSAI